MLGYLVVAGPRRERYRSNSTYRVRDVQVRADFVAAGAAFSREWLPFRVLQFNGHLTPDGCYALTPARSRAPPAAPRAPVKLGRGARWLTLPE